MLKKILFFIACLFPFLAIRAQFTDSFSDGDFANNPTWNGQTDKFEVNAAYTLWLNAPPVNDQAYLYTSSQSIDDASWECLVMMGFNPSSSNYARLYLTADQSNLLGSVNGYIVQVGSTDDDICLYKQTGNSLVKIIDGPNGVLNTASVNVRVRATRNSSGVWNLAADTSGNTNYLSYGTTTDNTHLQSLFSGISCTYTSTRSDKFLFDDFQVSGNAFNDGLGPYITNLTLINNTTLQITFNEPPLPASAENTGQYFISGGIGQPLSANINGADQKKLDLILSTAISYALPYNLSVHQITDYQLNMMQDTVLLFADYLPVRGDVVINEIMADPSPPVNLPEYEYVEILNTTNLPIQLQGWQYTVNTTTKTLTNYTLMPGAYLILAHSNAITEFYPHAILGISSFPSITNSGAHIKLEDAANNLMDEVRFNLQWYHNPNIDDGGYALEKINAKELCGGMYNWAGTLNSNGGTPGEINSIFSNLPISLDIVEIDAYSSDTIFIGFNKDIDTTALLPSSFYISGTIGTPLAVKAVSASEMKLILSSPLNANTTYTLTCYAGISDCVGTLTGININKDFMFYQPALYDIVLNEMMVDESPPVDLPLTEYIELYNRRNFPIRLKKYQIQVNNSMYVIPDITILPDSFIVLVKESWEGEFNGVPVVGMSPFPSLTNTGATITLRDKNGFLLHSITYTDKWYRNAAKANGGWSLEQIDPSKPCLDNSNWQASNHIKGGTPGFTNSVNQILTDSLRPDIYAVGIISPDTLVLYLRKNIMYAPTTESIHISGNIGNPLKLWIIEPALNKLKLALPVPLSSDSIYTMTVISSVTDCAGNSLKEDSCIFALPKPVEPLDIIINEILFNPPANAIDYIEIYNRTHRFIDLKEVYLGSGDTITGFISNQVPISVEPMLIAPHSYRLLSTDMQTVLTYYHTEERDAFIDLKTLPSYNNIDGTVTLSNISQESIDWVNYDESWHFALLNNKKGVSLERVNPHASSQDKSNWHSAAETVGFGTPGYQNSQFAEIASIAEKFTIWPEVFSPDQDGWDDVLFIQYHLSEPGYTATIKIYDASGKYVQTLANNQLIGTEGYFTWDGTDYQDHKARTGIHVIWFEMVNPNGKMDAFKAPCVVATKL